MRTPAQRQSKALYEAVGALRVVASRQTPATHNMCSARMMSTPGSANPMLTIMALALRQAEYIASEMSARSI